jgi:glycosyltransferase involved in cell wall biosynthesis
LTTGRESYGSQRQLQNLINNIDSNKYCPVVVHTEDIQSVEFQVPENIQTMKINLRPWRKVKNIFSRYFDAYKLLSFSRKQKIDLIHCNYQWLYPHALFVSKRMNIPLIQHIRRPNNTNFKKLEYEQAQAIITISKRIEKELDQLKKITHTIYDSIDDVFFKNTDSQILKKEFDLHDQVLFGLVGRIYKTKKQFEFIKAAEQLLNYGINAKFFIIGRVDNEKYYQELVEYIDNHSLTNDILFTGHRQNMPEIINSLDILVSLSGGSVMYEAMALGKTVISAGFTAPENSTHLIHNKTGLVTDSKDITDLLDFMKLAAEDYELRENLGKNAKEVAMLNLSSKIQATKTQQLYKQVLSNQVRPL